MGICSASIASPYRLSHHPLRHISPARASSRAEDDWRTKRQTLLKNKVRSVPPNEARRLQLEDGYMILDVRPKGDFGKIHPLGAVNVELYRLIQGWSAWDIARRIGFASFGIFEGTEENPNFVKEAGSKLEGEDSPIIVACAMGGSLRSTSSLIEGKESRSLIAAYLLVLAGYSQILHLEGGVQAWFSEGLPCAETSK